MTQYTNIVDNSNNYLWYQYSQSCSVENFDTGVYAKKGMKIENTIYVYDDRGLLLGIMNAPSEKECLKIAKRYILRKIFIALTRGTDDNNFCQSEKRELRKEEWSKLLTYIKSKFRKNETA